MAPRSLTFLTKTCVSSFDQSNTPSLERAKQNKGEIQSKQHHHHNKERKEAKNWVKSVGGVWSLGNLSSIQRDFGVYVIGYRGISFVLRPILRNLQILAPLLVIRSVHILRQACSRHVFFFFSFFLESWLNFQFIIPKYLWKLASLCVGIQRIELYLLGYSWMVLNQDLIFLFFWFVSVDRWKVGEIWSRFYFFVFLFLPIWLGRNMGAVCAGGTVRNRSEVLQERSSGSSKKLKSMRSFLNEDNNAASNEYPDMGTTGRTHNLYDSGELHLSISRELKPATPARTGTNKVYI